jgi:hypothetical protein
MGKQNGTTDVSAGSGKSGITGNDVRTALKAVQELDSRTRAQVEKLVARINGLTDDADSRYERIAQELFETVYAGDVVRALSPRGEQPLMFVALVRCVDDTLHLSRTQLSACVRVGALNHRLAKTGWSTLGWSVKLELLKLLGTELDFDALAGGVRWVEKHGPSVRALREWIAIRTTGAEGETEGAPKVPTFSTSAKVAAIGLALGKASARSRWVDGYRKLTPEAQSTLVGDLRGALRNFEKLVSELEKARGG